MILYKVVTLKNESCLAELCRVYGQHTLLKTLKVQGLIKEYNDNNVVTAEKNTLGILVFDSHTSAENWIKAKGFGSFKIKKVETIGEVKKVKRVARWCYPASFKSEEGKMTLKAPLGSLACESVKVIGDV